MASFWKMVKNRQKNGHKNGQKGDQKPSKMKASKFPAPIVEEVYRTIKRAISDLKELGYINKEHSKIKGEWQLLK